VVPEIPYPEPDLSDGVIALRRWGRDDVAQMTAGCQDPGVQRWTMVPADYTEAHAIAYLEHNEAERETGTALGFAIVDAGERSRVLGGIGVVRVDWINTRAEIGYWVAPSARRRGIATRALRLLSSWAIGELGFRRLHLTAFLGNLPSQRVAERAGYTREGVLRSYIVGKEGREDAVMFSLLPEEVPSPTA
jgi:RimJ/RimL family protein N-acetyltransferase